MLLGVLANDGLLAFFENRIGYTIGQRVDFPLSFLVNFIIVWSAGTVLYFISAVIVRRIAGRL